MPNLIFILETIKFYYEKRMLLLNICGAHSTCVIIRMFTALINRPGVRAREKRQRA